MKKTRKMFAVMLILALTLVFIPTTAQAVTETGTGTVTVTVTNATYEGAPSDRQGEFMSMELQRT